MNINQDRPADAPPVPGELMSKYGGHITDVWWNAKGRKEDPTIGVEIKGLRKTFGGYVWNEWWYYLKPTHYYADRVDYSWYRKKKIRNPVDPEHFTTLDEYVGNSEKPLTDPETGELIEIPPELEHDIDELTSD